MKQLYINSKLKAIVAFTTLTLFSVNAKAQCTPAPAANVGDTIVCSGSSAILVPFGGGPNYNWFATPSGTLLGTGSTFSTGAVTTNTTFYVAQYSTTDSASLNLPPYSSTYSGNSRGYYFTAPTTMTITGVRVPTDVGTGNYNVAILKFSATPPTYTTVTNTFTTMYLAQNQTGTTVVSVNIPVAYGDIIGVLGDRAGNNSYASGSPFNNIAFGSYTVTLKRLGMQFSLATTAPKDLWTENTGSISRVELYTNSMACLSPLTPVNVSVTVCTGIEELNADDFRVSPNPMIDQVNIKVGDEMAGTTYIELFDALGRSVIKETLTGKETKLNTSQLSQGIYIYKIYTANRIVKTDKLIKQ